MPLFDTTHLQVWPPIMGLLIQGFRNAGTPDAEELAASVGAGRRPGVWSSCVLLNECKHSPRIKAFSTNFSTRNLHPRPPSQLAETYVTQAYSTWAETGANFEKFNSTTVGRPGGGGEYTVVTGFGWTNGVGLHLIQQYQM